MSDDRFGSTTRQNDSSEPVSPTCPCTDRGRPWGTVGATGFRAAEPGHRHLSGLCGAVSSGEPIPGFPHTRPSGFEVVGIDLEDQPNYCGDDFLRADALAILEALVTGGGFAGYGLDDFEAFHASPPCLGETTLKYLHRGKAYPDLIGPVRELLKRTGKPYMIENVPHARRKLRDPVQLCGSSFGLGANGRQLRRHRLFECSFAVMVPPCQHQGQPIGVYGTGGGGQMTRGYKGTPEEYREAMGINWATRAEIAQAIPPAYAEHLGGYLMRALSMEAAA
jgi:DNA (cytosine-5)-methyltransferase 1